MHDTCIISYNNDISKIIMYIITHKRLMESRGQNIVKP